MNHWLMEMKMTKTITIKKGHSISDIIDNNPHCRMNLEFPNNVKGSVFTFLGSYDRKYWFNVVDFDGCEIKCPMRRGIIFGFSSSMEMVPFLKIRTGTSKRPAKQTENIVFAVSTK